VSALKQSLATEAAAPKSLKRKSTSGQTEMLMSIEGKKPVAKKAAKHERSTGKRKAGYSVVSASMT